MTVAQIMTQHVACEAPYWQGPGAPLVQTTVEPGGTTTVVAGAGGGGLLLLMQPARNAAGAIKTSQRSMTKPFEGAQARADGPKSGYRTGLPGLGCRIPGGGLGLATAAPALAPWQKTLYHLAQMLRAAAAPIDLGWSSGDSEDTFPMSRFEFLKVRARFAVRKVVVRRGTMA